MFFDSLNYLCMPTAGTEGAASGSSSSPFPMLIIMGVMIVAMYFLTIRPQKKKQQEEQKLRDAVQIGDEITTIGGINGRVVTVKEDSIVLETGADRTKMKIMRWAIQTNNTANDRAAEEKAKFEAAKAAEKEEKKSSKRRSKKSEENE